jgi:phosphate starvation-inducible PhoH-like protein
VHFPGTVVDKLSPWLMPALDVLRIFLGDGLYKYCIEKKVILLQPIETIRGRSFENAFIIIDEAQNLEIEETTSIVTRLGEYSTLALLGDPFQTDIKGLNGLVWFEQISKKYKLDIPSVHFTIDDVVRSKIVKEILVALYSEYQVKV